jgi:hypothetical protein
MIDLVLRQKLLLDNVMEPDDPARADQVSIVHVIRGDSGFSVISINKEEIDLPAAQQFADFFSECGCVSIAGHEFNAARRSGRREFPVKLALT